MMPLPSRLSTLAGPLAVVALAALAIFPLWAPGWPVSHEFVYFATRVAVWSAHFAQGDFFPVWSSADNFGLGSPQPSFYHRLFYLLPALIHWVSADMKLALTLGVFAFMLLGGFGMRYLLRALGQGECFAVTGAGTFLFAHYTAANWLVRGALAEFSGAMLVPWVLAFFLRLLSGSAGRAAAPGLGFCMAAVFYAHSTLAYFLTLTLSVIGVVALTSGVARLDRRLLLRLLAASLLAALVVAPGLWAMAQFRPDYELSRIVPPFYQPTHQVRPPGDYFWDSFRYGEHVQAFRVQLDLAVLALLAIAAMVLIGRRAVPRSLFLLLIPLLAALLLQTTAGAQVLELLPGGVYLQFPWRLLAIATPLLIVLAWQAWSSVAAVMPLSQGAVIGVLLLTLASSGGLAEWRGGDYRRFTVSQLDAWRHEPVNFSFFGEYLPRQVSPDRVPPLRWIRAQAAAQGCGFFALPDGQRFEPLRRRYLLRCTGPARVALPEFASPFHRVQIGEAAAGRCAANPELPGLCIVSLPAGDTAVAILMPRFSDLL